MVLKLSKAGLEVYKTEPMETEEEEEEETTTEETDTENTDEEEEEEEPTAQVTSTGDASSNFVLENGATIQIDYVGELFSDSYEMDYTDITSSSSVSVPIDYTDLFFKGKKIALKKGWDDGTLKWDDMETAVLGFVTELTWNRDKTDLKISGMDKLMDVEAQFDFQQMKRSEIVKQIIETAGLKAVVDTTGLIDDVCDFTNISSSGDDDTGGYDGEVSEDIAKAAKQICKGKKSCLDKAKAIYQWCHDNMSYEKYSGSDKGAEGCFRDRAGNCCDHAHVVVQMLKAVGVKAAYEHDGSCYDGLGHVWAIAYCDGNTYRLDASVKSTSFNEAGGGCSGEITDSIDF
jgi:transglutaminase-like putative cysteine protease